MDIRAKKSGVFLEALAAAGSEVRAQASSNDVLNLFPTR